MSKYHKVLFMYQGLGQKKRIFNRILLDLKFISGDLTNLLIVSTILCVQSRAVSQSPSITNWITPLCCDLDSIIFVLSLWDLSTPGEQGKSMTNVSALPHSHSSFLDGSPTLC